MASMGSRKRVKPSPPGGVDSQSINPSSQSRERSNSRKSLWYPSVWPSKAAPVTEVARESISMAKPSPSHVASVSTSQLDTSKQQQRNPPLQLTKRAGVSTRSLPANATTTCINIASDGSTSTPAVDIQPDPTSPPGETVDKEVSKDSSVVDTENSVGPQSNPTGETGDSGDPSAAESQPSGWLSWVYAPFANDKATSTDPAAEPTPEHPPEPEISPVEQPLKEDGISTAPDPSPQQQIKPPEVTEVSSTPQKRSWMEMWYGSSSKGPEEPKDEAPADAEQAPPGPIESSGPKEDSEIPKTDETSADPTSTSTKPSAWSFWFRDSPKESVQGNLQEAQAAEATMIQESSTEQPASDPNYKPDQKTEIINKGSVNIKALPGGSSVPDNAVQKLADGPEAPAPAATEAAASKQLQRVIPSQVLPHFKDTFALQDRPTLLQSIGRFLHYNKEPNNQHVYKVPFTPRVKRALAIGVHGYFPAPFIRSVLGQPTGTSVRFSNMAAESIRKYTEDRGYNCEIEKIALEGEGRIVDRVDLLWKLLLNWMEEIRRADFILIACHSQGVPVGIMLVAKLISFGCINANRVGICAMAGVNLGPFSDYRSRWISGSAGELFEFALPYSQVSKDYESALRTCVDYGVRISYIGSIDDQLVSLESSLFSPISHPYIYRAVFVDGRVHAPSFVSHLVGFALKLRNLGISDHGLIRELSSPLAGSLYTGEGHSRLYDDEAVYRLAIEVALETSTVSNASLHITRNHPPPATNPYILPFAMRGLLEEEYVRHELYNETMELLKQFDDWKPTSKVLKDVKFRLEGIRSKL
ncbi:hypothetical protein BDW59DRAFT_28958 [Aspergillus cavernicola]|uniref:YMC020W-like alpha/beta hydrolase domain-containing protein n=1 Tax=Aspergillus cavernicola TaxID=176166 RepID=A0ABR4IQC5_9EURO